MPGLPGLSTTDALIEALSVLCTALGLSTASGLRAYLPLLVIALGSHVSVGHGAHLIELTQPFQFLGSPVAIAVLVVLAVGELVVDAIPVLVHASDLLHTLVRPLAGAVVMAGTVNALSQRNIWLAGVVGAVLALAVHLAKAASRPPVTVATAGIGNPLASVAEDVIALVLIALSVVASLLMLAVLPVVAVALAVLLVRGLRWYARLRRGRPALDRRA